MRCEVSLYLLLMHRAILHREICTYRLILGPCSLIETVAGSTHCILLQGWSLLSPMELNISLPTQLSMPSHYSAYFSISIGAWFHAALNNQTVPLVMTSGLFKEPGILFLDHRQIKFMSIHMLSTFREYRKHFVY